MRLLVVFRGTGPDGADGRNLDEIIIEFSDKPPKGDHLIDWSGFTSSTFSLIYSGSGRS